MKKPIRYVTNSLQVKMSEHVGIHFLQEQKVPGRTV